MKTNWLDKWENEREEKEKGLVLYHTPQPRTRRVIRLLPPQQPVNLLTILNVYYRYAEKYGLNNVETQNAWNEVLSFTLEHQINTVA